MSIFGKNDEEKKTDEKKGEIPTENKNQAQLIADEVLGAKDPLNLLFSILVNIDKKDTHLAYLITKRFSQDVKNYYISDLGYVGIAERSLPKIPIFHGDIVIYGSSAKLATGDIAQMIFKKPNDNTDVDIRHARITNFANNGLVELRDTSTDFKYIIQRWQIMGKIIKVIKFNTKEWKELFGKLSIDEEALKTLISNAIPFLEKSELKNKDEIVKELKGRLVLLSKK